LPSFRDAHTVGRERLPRTPIMALTADYQIGSLTYPRGWLMVAASAAVTSVPSEARFFGEDVVLYRGASGRPVMVSAYCPHMGAHLAVGPIGATAQHGMQVQDDSIRCPNHGWRFGPDGRCKEIPYSTMKVPDTMRLKTWRLEERAGCVFAWQDEEGGEPTYELPEVPEWTDPRWIHSPIEEMGEMDVHPLELAEHGIDKIHLANVHGADRVTYHRVTFEAHRAQTTSHTGFSVPGVGEIAGVAHSRYVGPAFLLAEIEGDRPSILLFCHTPVHDGRVRSWHAVLMRARGDTVTVEDRAAHQQMLEVSRLNFEQDLQMFKRKRPTLRAVQIPGDPPFRHYRLWYSQFYAPRSEVPSIQSKANAVIETDGVHVAPWVAAG
jgi:phenylpropionate dioxygenase-like ring-hydroxylating dioxygenase large terminal subunit